MDWLYGIQGFASARFSLWTLMFSAHREPRVPRVESLNRAQLVDRYFRPTPPARDKRLVRGLGWIGLAVLILGAILAFYEWLSGAVVILIGMGALLNAVSLTQKYVLEFGRAEPKPSEAQMDAWLDQDRRTACKHAELAQGESRQDIADVAGDLDDPPAVLGPVLDDRAGPPCSVARGKWRFQTNQVLVVYPTASHLSLYKCEIPVRSGQPRGGELREVRFSDVSVCLMDNAEDVTVAALAADGSAAGVFTDKLRLRELQVVSASGDRSEILVDTDDPRLADAMSLLRSILSENQLLDLSGIAPTIGASVGQSLREELPGVMARVTEPIPAAVAEGVRNAILGPPRQNFDGWVSVELSDGTVPVTLSSQGSFSVMRGRDYDLFVVISRREADGVAQRLLVTEGVDVDEVQFDIDIDSGMPPVMSVPRRVTLTPSEDGIRERFTLSIPLIVASDPDPDTWVWVRVSQNGWTLQNVRFNLDLQ